MCGTVSKLLPLFLTIFVGTSACLASENNAVHEVRTYMQFTFPVDPAKIHIIPDLNISYALATTLVEWDDEKEITAGLAESWKVIAPNTYRFTLRRDARWSNGNPVTASDVKTSFDRNLRQYPQDLRGLSQVLGSIEVFSTREIDFKLKIAAQESALLGKLTKPNFGIIKIDDMGRLDPSVTSGPFSLLPQSDNSQLTLVRNPNWIHFEPEASTASRILIRRPLKEMDSHTVLLSDSWANYIETSSLMGPDLIKRYEGENFEVRKSPLDKFCHLQLGKRVANADGHALMRFLQQRIDPKNIGVDLVGMTTTSQFYPRGYPLYDPEFSCQNTPVTLPSHFQSKPLDVLMCPARVTPTLKENIRRAIVNATGVQPNFIEIPLNELWLHQQKGDFDIYIASVGIADLDPEQVMSFFLEGPASQIPPEGNNLLQRFDMARKEKDFERKTNQMRMILRDLVCEGLIMPMFHLSTIGIARGELALSQIPSSEEFIRFPKLRFKDTVTMLERP